MKRTIITLSIVLAAIAAKAQDILPIPEWRLGTGVLKGKIENFDPSEKSRSSVFPCHILPDVPSELRCEIAADGTFCIDVPMYATTQTVRAVLGAWSGLIILTQGDTLSVNVSGQSARFSGPMADVNNEVATTEIFMLAHKYFFQQPENLPPAGTSHTPDEYFSRIRAWRDKIQHEIDALNISPASRQLLSIYQRTAQFYSVCRGNGGLQRNEYGQAQHGEEIIAFAKEMNLNNMLLAYGGDAQLVVNNFYNACYSGIPELAEICTHGVNSADRYDPILFEEIFDSLTEDFIAKRGFSTDGLFHEARLANRLCLNLKSDTPFFPQQIQDLNASPHADLRDHYIALNENMKREIAERMEKFAPTFHHASDCSGEEVIAQIAAQNAGQPVLIDFWGTWCAACLSAMKNIEPKKPKLAARGLQFCYITDHLSPEDAWRDKASQIPGQHYRLTKQQTAEIFQKYGFTGWPSYMILDKSGKTIYYQTSYQEDAILPTLEKALAE